MYRIWGWLRSYKGRRVLRARVTVLHIPTFVALTFNFVGRALRRGKLPRCTVS